MKTDQLLDAELFELEEHFKHYPHHQDAHEICENAFEAKILQDLNSEFSYQCLRRCCYNNYLKVSEWIIRINPKLLINNVDKTDPLEIACQMGHHELTKLLLKPLVEHSEKIDDLILKKMLCETLCMLIKRLVDKDENGDEDLTTQYENCFNEIFQIIKSKQINTEEHKDRFGYTALFYAKYYNLPEIEVKILDTVRLNYKYEGVTTIDKVESDILRQHLDKRITLNDETNGVADVKININYKGLCPDLANTNETEVIFEISQRSKFQNLLSHPVILCFLKMKWNITIYKIWLWLSVLLTFFEIVAFSCCIIDHNISVLKVIITFTQFFQAVPVVVASCKNFTLDKIMFVILSLIAIASLWLSNILNQDVLKVLSFIVITMLTFKLMNLLGIFVLYGEMFKIVLWNIFKILGWYAIVLFFPMTCGYYLAFYGEENPNISNENIIKSFYDIFIFIIGNIPEHSYTLTNTLILLFLVFLLPIAFLNLLIAQAVTEIEKLENAADVICQRHKIRFIYDTEMLAKICKLFDSDIFKTDSRTIHGHLNYSIQYQNLLEIKLDKKIIDSINVLMDRTRRKMFIVSGLLKMKNNISQSLENSQTDVIEMDNLLHST